MEYEQNICIQLTTNLYLFNRSEPQITKTQDFDFSESLLSTYDIIDNILDFLSYDDLRTLVHVNSAWANCIREYLKKRLSPNVFCFSHDSLATKQGRSSDYIKPSFSIVFLNPVRMKLENYICVHKGTTASHSKQSVIEFIIANLLSQEVCPIVVLSCQQSDFCLPAMYFNGVGFPSIPGLNIKVIRISEDNKYTIPETINQNLGEDTIVSSLLAFCQPVRKDFLYKKLLAIVEAIEARQPSKKFSFGGGLVTGIKTFNAERNLSKVKKVKDVLCVAFTTPKNEDINFDTYSIKITEKMINNNEVEDFIIDFKKHYKRRKHSVALRFSCLTLDDIAREVIELFVKHFPDVQLSGFSCNGEIGWNSYKTDTAAFETTGIESSEPSVKKRKKGEPLVNYFTIIFVILSWGKYV